ncbi:MAG: peptidylprolyl isomerase [Bacteroides sp.]|nr:peptidylprolyl isomerase [Bacteroides sp.]
MSKKIYWIPVVVLVASLFTACKESEEPGKYDNWQEPNEAYMDSLENVYKTQASGLSEKDSLYRFEDPFAQQAYVYYKKLNPEEKENFGPRPLYTDNVSMYFQAFLIDDVRVGGNFTDDAPGEFDAPRQDVSVKEGRFGSGVVWALQYMQVGERWKLYIPWASVGLPAEFTGLPEYSNLIFDLVLEEITNRE